MPIGVLYYIQVIICYKNINISREFIKMTRICRNNDYNMGDNPFSLHHVDVNSNSVFARILIGIRHSKLDEIDIIYYFQEIRHRSYLEDTNINHILNVIECTVNKPCTNIARIEKDSKTDMIYLMTEDKIDRYDLRIVRPHKEHSP